MTAHTPETLRRQLAEIDSMIESCGDNPNLARLKDHLRGRRDVTIGEIEKLERSISAAEMPTTD